MHLSAFLQFEHFTDFSIREYRSILASILAQYSEPFAYNANIMPAYVILWPTYYAFNYAGIFDAGLCRKEKNSMITPKQPRTCSNPIYV